LLLVRDHSHALIPRFADNPKVRAFVEGVTAAATGAIAGAALVLGRRALIDLTILGISVATLLVFTHLKKLPEPLVILAAGMAGLRFRPVAALCLRFSPR
jgi:chromate transporter